MKKHLLILVILLVTVLFSGAQYCNCKELRQSTSLRQDSLVCEKLEQVLWCQIKQGESALYDNSFDIETYKYSINDLECLNSFLAKILIKEGFIPPTKAEFAKIIKEVFGRTIDYRTNLEYLYVNMNDSKDRNPKYYRSDNSIEIHPFGIFVLKDYCFITQLYAIPEIIDYKTKFPDVFKKECKLERNKKDKNGDEILLYLWKDNKEINIVNNIRTFIARNRFLLNNDSTQLEWLLNNDKFFMKSLIETYGYRKYKKHVEWYDKTND